MRGEAAPDRSFDARRAADGIVLANRELGLGLRIACEGEAMGRAFFEVDENTARIAFKIDTEPIILMPACLLKLRQVFTVLAGP